ncbi:uncharacterized protein K02A2.6 [Trichonephila clavipes]|nr:uncharacterized protein K02A2.6 [Trichonephila clavipes]
MEQQIADLLRQNQDLIRAPQIRDDSHSHKRFEQYPFALKGRVENEIDRLEKEGIIEKVDSFRMATPVVLVVKSDGSIRLCADYSVTLNPNLIVPHNDIEEAAKTVLDCARYKADPPNLKCITGNIPYAPGNVFHVDFAGPIFEHTFFLIVDAQYSKWLEVYPMKVTTTKKTIECLRDSFARFDYLGYLSAIMDLSLHPMNFSDLRIKWS